MKLQARRGAVGSCVGSSSLSTCSVPASFPHTCKKNRKLQAWGRFTKRSFPKAVWTLGRVPLNCSLSDVFPVLAWVSGIRDLALALATHLGDLERTPAASIPLLSPPVIGDCPPVPRSQCYSNRRQGCQANLSWPTLLGARGSGQVSLCCWSSLDASRVPSWQRAGPGPQCNL